MTKRSLIIILSAASSMAFYSLLFATPADEAVPGAEQAEQQAKLAAEYEQALNAADKSQAEAAAVVESAREQLHLAAERQQREVTANDKQLEELAAMRAELSRAHHQLRESSRAIAQVNRDMARAKMANQASSFVFRTGDRPVLGVILGDDTDVGIKVLGVSPDGPAERAGVKAGDTIVALGGRVLVDVDETGNTRTGLKIALKDIKAGEPVIVSVDRDSKELEFTVVPEVREPLSWQSVVRLPPIPSAPPLPGDTIMIERIVVPEMDPDALTEQIKTMRVEIEERRALMGAGVIAPLPEVRRYEFQFDNMSEMGDFALHDAYTWFGMPLASGLRLAKVGPALGEYFKTDRGVLILQAKDGNGLLLQAGDVILSLQGTEVNSPAEFMRALREFKPGNELEIDIKRKRRNKTLTPVIDESHARFSAPRPDGLHTITVTAD